MSSHTHSKKPRSAMFALPLVALLGACGGAPSDSEGLAEENTATVESALAASVSVTCSGRSTTTGELWCTGTVSGGAPPFVYQWQIVDDFGQGNQSNYWTTGSTTYDDWCFFKLSTTGTHWRKWVRFRVTDSTGAVSNVAETSRPCWSPN